MQTATAAEQHNHSHSQNRFAVIPTLLRLNAQSTYTGKGVTIAVLDSGFYPHPDLIEPQDRILAYHDVTNPQAELDTDQAPPAWAWHGTQTSVVAAGNGYLSEGIYRGLASDAAVVLVKVSGRGHISDENIVRGLAWVIEHKDKYGIRVVSMSLGGDEDVSFRESIVDQAAEAAVRAGLVVVVAAGNSGCSDNPRPIPPANSPSVITVGGYDDFNRLKQDKLGLYCSNYGHTLDGLVKPEIIAPAIWVAAPILPGSGFYQRAEALSQLAAAPDYQLQQLAQALSQVAELPAAMLQANTEQLRAFIDAQLRDSKIIATHYQHVDGTSFATPIVASVIAQMLEANPHLTPPVIKHILISTADRISDQALLRQGYGVLNAHRAVAEARRERHTDPECDFNPPRVEGGRLVFYFHHDEAESVTLAGDFNGWDTSRCRFDKQKSGMWRAEIELPVSGIYRYKLVINQTQWLDDPSNGLREPDEYGGFNSLLHIAELE
jgi:serine protease AprX